MARRVYEMECPREERDVQAICVLAVWPGKTTYTRTRLLRQQFTTVVKPKAVCHLAPSRIFTAGGTHATQIDLSPHYKLGCLLHDYNR